MDVSSQAHLGGSAWLGIPSPLYQTIPLALTSAKKPFKPGLNSIVLPKPVITFVNTLVQLHLVKFII